MIMVVGTKWWVVLTPVMPFIWVIGVSGSLLLRSSLVFLREVEARLVIGLTAEVVGMVMLQIVEDTVVRVNSQHGSASASNHQG